MATYEPSSALDSKAAEEIVNALIDGQLASKQQHDQLIAVLTRIAHALEQQQP